MYIKKYKLFFWIQLQLLHDKKNEAGIIVTYERYRLDCQRKYTSRKLIWILGASESDWRSWLDFNLTWGAFQALVPTNCMCLIWYGALALFVKRDTIFLLKRKKSYYSSPFFWGRNNPLQDVLCAWPGLWSDRMKNRIRLCLSFNTIIYSVMILIKIPNCLQKKRGKNDTMLGLLTHIIILPDGIDNSLSSCQLSVVSYSSILHHYIQRWTTRLLSRLCHWKGKK